MDRDDGDRPGYRTARPEEQRTALDSAYDQQALRLDSLKALVEQRRRAHALAGLQVAEDEGEPLSSLHEPGDDLGLVRVHGIVIELHRNSASEEVEQRLP